MAATKINRSNIPGPSFLPSAALVSRAENVAHNTATLFNLVKPIGANSTRFQSNDGITNVLPRGRMYRLESLDELDTFKIELLRRPTVLQCQFRTGRGMAGCQFFPNFDCRMGTRESDWVIMLNQLHPKILSRYQMGIDMIRKAIVNGVPCVLQFSFNEKIREIMPSLLGPTVENFSYFNCEFAEMNLIYSGAPSKFAEVKNIARSREILFNFEDLTESDIILQTVENGVDIPIGEPRTEGDLKRFLKGWQFSLSEDPTMEPRSRYSYATAGRMLYNLNETDDTAESQI